MAKPTPRQKQVIELLIQQCRWWLESNDIHSPSHGTDIDSELGLLELDALITQREHEELSDAIGHVWDKVAGMDACPHRAAQVQKLRDELGVAAAEPSAGPSAVSPSKTREDAAAVPNAEEIVAMALKHMTPDSTESNARLKMEIERYLGQP